MWSNTTMHTCVPVAQYLLLSIRVNVQCIYMRPKKNPSERLWCYGDVMDMKVTIYLFVINTFTWHLNRVLDVYVTLFSRCIWFLAIWSSIYANISVIPRTISLDFEKWKISQKFLLEFFLGKASIFGSWPYYCFTSF